MTRAVAFGLATLALGFFIRTAAVQQAAAQEVSARDADGQRPATLQEIKALLRQLRLVSAELDTVQASVESSDDPAEPAARNSQDWRWAECRFQGLNDPLWTAREERLTAECAVDKWSVPGGLAEFLSIQACESGGNRLAYNPGGPYVGLFQHALSAYVSRISTYSPPSWDRPLSADWRNSRGQIVMSARMMHADGTGAWSCA